MRFPLAELFSTRLAESLAAKVRTAYNVGAERIMGIPCEHLALREIRTTCSYGLHKATNRCRADW